MSAPVLDVEILTENVEGSILRYEDHLESLVALFASCHGRIDTFTRTGRCKRDEAERFLLDVIDRHGQLLLGRRVFAAADAAGIERWSLVDTRKRWASAPGSSTGPTVASGRIWRMRRIGSKPRHGKQCCGAARQPSPPR